MCFRPATATKSVECPKCGKKFPVVGGVKQKKCPICKTDLISVEVKSGEEAPAPPESK